MFNRVKPSPVVLVALGSMHISEMQVPSAAMFPNGFEGRLCKFSGESNCRAFCWLWRLGDQIVVLLTGQQTVYVMCKYMCKCTSTYTIWYHFRKHLETPGAVFGDKRFFFLRLEMQNTWVMDKNMNEEYKQYNLNTRPQIASVWENTRSVVSKRSLDKKDCRSKNHERLVYIM